MPQPLTWTLKAAAATVHLRAELDSNNNKNQISPTKDTVTIPQKMLAL